MNNDYNPVKVDAPIVLPGQNCWQVGDNYITAQPTQAGLSVANGLGIQSVVCLRYATERANPPYLRSDAGPLGRSFDGQFAGLTKQDAINYGELRAGGFSSVRAGLCVRSSIAKAALGVMNLTFNMLISEVMLLSDSAIRLKT